MANYKRPPIGMVELVEGGECVVRLPGRIPFTLSRLQSLDLHEQIRARSLIVESKPEYQQWLRERVQGAAFSASVELVAIQE